jgi:non-canonical purine NTP pyrophosphatase (RdgB/HAM1 family)
LFMSAAAQAPALTLDRDPPGAGTDMPSRSGRVHGQATWPPRGAKGFGYDPMFLPGGTGKTFGELDPIEKHVVSHRARAFAQFMAARLGKSERR